MSAQGYEGLLETYEEDGYLVPDYAAQNIANLPDTVARLLSVEASRPLYEEVTGHLDTNHETPIEHVVLVVIDGLGWNRFTSFRQSIPHLDALADVGCVTPLVSTYPSETSAAMITLYTGLQPVEHGSIGWFARFHDPTYVGVALPFVTRDGDPLDEAFGYDGNDLFDVDVRPMLSERLLDAGYTVGFAQPAHLNDSTTSKRACGDGERIGYEDFTSGLDRVRTRIERAPNRSYHQVYYADVDTAGHHHGTTSRAYHDATHRAVTALYEDFLTPLDPDIAAKTAILVVADHGQLDTTDQTRIDLNELSRDAHLDLSSHLEVVDGEAIYLAGSPRNLQLYTRSGHADSLREQLTAVLDARIYTRGDILSIGLFGDRSPGEYFQRRVPDILVVPRDSGIWYDDGQLDVIGMHGGMHPHEMVVPLISARASTLTSAIDR